MITINKPISKTTESPCTTCPRIDCVVIPVREEPKAPSPPPVITEKRKAGIFSGIFGRLRKVKHIEIYAAVVVIAIMCLVFFSSIDIGGSKKTENSLDSVPQVEETASSELESRLRGILSNISGVGNASVMATENGIVIVADGATDPATQFRILHAVQTLVDDPEIIITILPRNKF